MRHSVVRHPLGQWVDPAAAYARLASGAQNSFWLDSGVGASTGMSYIGSSSRVLGAEASGAGFFDAVRAELARTTVEPDAAAPAFRLGLVGWLGYELRGATMGVTLSHVSRYPDAALMVVDRAVAFDHASGEVALLALSPAAEWTAELDQWRLETITALQGAAALPGPTHTPASTVPTSTASGSTVAAWRYSDDEYLAMIAECQREIAAGNAYQLCLTTEATVAVSPDPLAAYVALRASSPTHHGGLIRVGDVALLSSSPEQFLTVSPTGIVESRPIKGTRRRGTTAEEDAQLRAELLASDKERAENLMIVDLMRNDIGRISEVGSVSVPRLLEVESYAQVHQLVSTVRGTLAAGLTGVDAVVACFPAGSMTGAPKLSATLILDRLEDRARGIYAGAFGYFGFDGAIDLAMVIRSIVIDPLGSTVGAGGGITALSNPEEELEEVRIKAAALLAVLGA